MKRVILSIVLLVLVGLTATATTAQLYFSFDKNGETHVTRVQEGQSVFLVVVDNDENLDCDIRDKFWTDVKLMDPKTGANLDWESWGVCGDAATVGFIGRNGCTGYGHFFEETGADTGVFVSNVSFQIGRRISKEFIQGQAHWVGFDFDGYNLAGEFISDTVGDWVYFGDFRDTLDSEIDPDYRPFVGDPHGPWHGWFENMDTLIGLVQDPDDPSDVAIAMMKIIDSEGAISWNREVYPDANEAATITVVDPDENLSPNDVEYVPVFVLVNPGSWNEEEPQSATTFCMLWRFSGVWTPWGAVNGDGIWPANIYDTGFAKIDLRVVGSDQPDMDGTYYVEYPNANHNNVVAFDTASNSGVTRVMFFAQETGPDTGIFEFRLNSILFDLGFRSLRVRDVMVAYYLDPNDFDDFKVATAYIGEHAHSATMLTDADGSEQNEYWIGRDPIYAQVLDENANTDSCCPEQVVVHLCTPHEEDDSEWWLLDEASSNSPIFLSRAGMALVGVWDALGIGNIDDIGGYQMNLDNWRYEAFNEDDILARYNDATYEAGEFPRLGDRDPDTAFPPEIHRTRVANDLSFDMASIGDTQVFLGEATNMWFLNRAGQRVTEYTSASCVFIEVLDPDQDEDTLRRERISGYWADIENAWPFAPEGLLMWDCGPEQGIAHHTVNDRLGYVSIFGTHCGPKIAILNPRNGYWAALDLLETGVSTGNFVSLTCVELNNVTPCVPTLRALPGDTLIAQYQDPSNHSDSAWISIKVDVGGGLPGGNVNSTTSFVDADGNEVESYGQGDEVYVRVIDPSHVGESELLGALEIGGVLYDLELHYDVQTLIPEGRFRAGPLALAQGPGTTLTATYTDPTDPSDTSTATADVVGDGALSVERFFAAPSPFAETCVFGFAGSGVATTTRVEVFDLSGERVWSAEAEGDIALVWDGRDESGRLLANGGYLYTIVATDGTKTFTDRGLVFIRR